MISPLILAFAMAALQRGEFPQDTLAKDKIHFEAQCRIDAQKAYDAGIALEPKYLALIGKK